jgi:hypothetical protein
MPKYISIYSMHNNGHCTISTPHHIHPQWNNAENKKITASNRGILCNSSNKPNQKKGKANNAEASHWKSKPREHENTHAMWNCGTPHTQTP